VGFDQAGQRSEESRAGLFLIDSALRPRFGEVRSLIRPAQKLLLLVHHLVEFEPWNRTKAAVWAAKEELFRFDGFVVPSQHAAQAVEELCESRPVIVIRPALVVRPRERRPDAEGFRGLLAASLIRCKGVLSFLEHLDRRLKEQDELFLDVVGREDFEPGYARACHDLVAGSPRLARRVRLHGPVSPDAMISWYEQSTVFVSPSENETFGMALHEARAFGLPVLALDRSHAREHVVESTHGCRYPTTAELAESCLQLARDPVHLARLRAEAFAHRLRDERTWEDAARDLVTGLRAAFEL
jgi:glycosyltransferase involved in cell wall biosynthesis